jgi:hypothetical protein
MMTRTATVRVVLPNERHQLHEGMYATAQVEVPAAASAILLPREAVIDSGTRQIVFVALGGGHFEPRQVTIGRTGHLANPAGSSADGPPPGDDLVQILTGLGGNETVVTSGQFLLDTESRTKEATQKFLRDRLAAAGGGAATPTGTAVPPPTGTRPAAAPADQRVDALYKAYLDFSNALATRDEPVSSAAIDAAAAAAAGGSEDARLKALVGAVHASVDDLAGKPVDKQREAFKRVSAAMARLAEAYPPSRAAGAAIYQFHCPMVDADWLQRSPDIANPYMASMRACGTATRKVTPEGVQILAPPAPGGGAP